MQLLDHPPLSISEPGSRQRTEIDSIELTRLNERRHLATYGIRLHDSATRERMRQRILELLEPVEGYPAPGQHIRWRYRLGTVPIVMHDRPLEVATHEKLRSTLSLGLLQLESTHTLAVDGEASMTRLSHKVLASNSAPVVGGSIDRFDIRRIATEFVDTRLRSLKAWIENEENRKPPIPKA